MLYRLLIFSSPLLPLLRLFPCYQGLYNRKIAIRSEGHTKPISIYSKRVKFVLNDSAAIHSSGDEMGPVACETRLGNMASMAGSWSHGFPLSTGKKSNFNIPIVITF